MPRKLKRGILKLKEAALIKTEIAQRELAVWLKVAATLDDFIIHLQKQEKYRKPGKEVAVEKGLSPQRGLRPCSR